jgi:hypothetical protein
MANPITKVDSFPDLKKLLSLCNLVAKEHTLRAVLNQN